MLKLLLTSHPELGNFGNLSAVDQHLEGHYLPIHPLYGILQAKSIFQKELDYFIPRYDMSEDKKELNLN